MSRNPIYLLMLSVIVSILWGCGGSGGTTAATVTTATGKFVDAPVEGLKYVSGSHSGFTGSNGEFMYEVGQQVTFSVGGVVLGQARGASVITPVDLVKAATKASNVTASTPAVVQMAQFLLTASSLTSTGIKIDPAVTAACTSQNIDISSAPNSTINTMISTIAATAGNRNITTATDAENHIVESMKGLSSGTIVLPPASVIGGSSGEPSATVSVFMYAGSVQCFGGGTSLTEMQRQLKDASIQVKTANCGYDGRVYIAMCGVSDGRIGIFEIPATQAQDAAPLGFALLSNLPDAAITPCN